MRRILPVAILLLCFFAAAATADTHTTSAAGAYSNTAVTWGGSAPEDGDAVVFAHDVTYDFDCAGWAVGFAGFTINASKTVTVSNAASTVILMKSAVNLTNNGTLTCASSAAPLSEDYTCVIYLVGGGDVAGTGTLNLYCTQPTILWTTASEAIDATTETEISVATDLTADAVWDVGDEIAIIDVGGSLPDVETATIAAGGISADHIDITAGLTNAKTAGCYIVLLTRNIRIDGDDNAACFPLNGLTSGVIWAEIKDAARAAGSCRNMTLKITTNSCVSYGVTNLTYCTFLDSYVDTPIPFSSCQGCYSDGCLYGGSSAGGAAISTGDVACSFTDCTFAGNGSVVAYLTTATFNGCTFTGNTRTISNASSLLFNNCNFADATENLGYNTNYVAPWEPCVSYDHDGTAGAFKQWTRGGVVLSENVTVPTGYTTSYKHTCEDATMECWRQEEFSIEPGETLTVNGQIKIADDHSAWAPRLQIINSFSDPLMDATITPLATDSIDTADGTNTGWQAVSVTYTNSGALAQKVFIRCSAKRASGDVYEVWDIADASSLVGYRSRYAP